MQRSAEYRDNPADRRPTVANSALAAALPKLTEDMSRISRLFSAGQRASALEQFYDLAARAISTQCDDVSCQGHVVQASTTQLSICRIPARPRPGKPIALFLPGLLASLPLTAVRTLAFIDLFDIVLCELPGHGASGEVADVSLAAFALEYATLIDTCLQQASNLFVIGESLGGLLALTLAQMRPDKIRNVILIDTPFLLTRPDLAAWISEVWRNSGKRPYVRRICTEIMGFDPANGEPPCATPFYDLARNASFGCVHIVGSDQQTAGIASVFQPTDAAALQAVCPTMLMTPRIPGTGHAVLLDNPAGARAALKAFITNRESCRAFPS